MCTLAYWCPDVYLCTWYACTCIYLFDLCIHVSVHLRAHVFIYRQTGIRLCIYMYVRAPEEQGTTARSRDTRVPVTGGVACDAHLAASCRCRMGGRRWSSQARTVTQRQQPCWSQPAPNLTCRPRCARAAGRAARAVARCVCACVLCACVCVCVRACLHVYTCVCLQILYQTHVLSEWGFGSRSSAAHVCLCTCAHKPVRPHMWYVYMYVFIYTCSSVIWRPSGLTYDMYMCMYIYTKICI